MCPEQRVSNGIGYCTFKFTAMEKYDSIDKLLIQAVSAYENAFKQTPTHASFAPGRVNIIGEHTDYNDGFVFPMVSFKE